MQLEELFLRKEELPILNEICFQIPIHPKLLDSNLKIDESLAQRIFPEVAEEWKKELISSPLYYNKQFTQKPFETSHIVQCADNGLATGFQISRDHGGGIYFYEEDDNCIRSLNNQYIKFSKEKIQEFELKKLGNHSLAWVYAPTNIDHYPGALFLRNWAIKYMNEVFKQVFK